jgi:transcriptional regulator with XRE-family HTH domain
VKDELQKALGERVRQLRLRMGYSQEAFADHCGVHRTFMGTIERGETNLSLQNLARIAAGLGITLSKLFSGIERHASQITGGDEPGSRGDRLDGRQPRNTKPAETESKRTGEPQSARRRAFQQALGRAQTKH